MDLSRTYLKIINHTIKHMTTQTQNLSLSAAASSPPPGHETTTLAISPPNSPHQRKHPTTTQTMTTTHPNPPKISTAILQHPPTHPYFSLEFFPPRTPSGLTNLYPRLQRLHALNPLFICITYSAGGSSASTTLELAELCLGLGFRVAVHLTCTNCRRGVVGGFLERCREVGVRNLVALRGDEPREGEYAFEEERGKEVVNGSAGDAADGDARDGGAVGGDGEEKETFTHAADLIRYIRRKHGDYFCIGAAAYPEGHPVASAQHPGGYYQDPLHDLPFLVEKVEAGADFLLTQLFYDVDAYLRFERMLRGNRVFDHVPVIPGLMPVQGWGSFTRTCKLARVGVPEGVRGRLVGVKGDDEGVKRVGVEVVGEIMERIQREGKRRVSQGFHFYTLNLEKAVAQILERCGLVSNGQLVAHGGESAVVDGAALPYGSSPKTKTTRRRSSAHNRVIVHRRSHSKQNADYETLDSQAGHPRPDQPTKEDALEAAEGEGSMGRVATWDDFPNGRWGDARSPAYAPTNNYSLHPNLSRTPALRLWSEPQSVEDVTSIFRRYLLGSLSAIPWSEEDSAVEDVPAGLARRTDPEGGLRPETAMIKDELLGINAKGWWTVASQPAVNAAKSSDEVVGWGPRKGGFVWQKPFVEFFLPSKAWANLKNNLDEVPLEATYFAGNAKGDFQATDEKSVNPVTWGAFKGKEIITPTIIEAISYRAWQTEAFDIWREWQNVFHPSSPSAKLLGDLRNDVWLVNVIGHDYTEAKKFWDLLLED